MAVEDFGDGERVAGILRMVDCAVVPAAEVVDVVEGESEDEVEQVADGVLVVGVSPEEEPASVQAIPRFVFREDLELAVGGVHPAVAVEEAHFAVAPWVSALFIWVDAYEPPVVTNLACVVPGKRSWSGATNSISTVTTFSNLDQALQFSVSKAWKFANRSTTLKTNKPANRESTISCTP